MDEEGNSVFECVRVLDESLVKIIERITKVLSNPAKSFDIMYRKKLYSFGIPTTKRERKRLEKSRNKFIKIMLQDTLKFAVANMIDKKYENADLWPFIRALVSGANTRDHQYEVIKDEEIIEINEEGRTIKGKPLNYDSVYVKWQDNKLWESDDRELISEETSENI